MASGSVTPLQACSVLFPTRICPCERIWLVCSALCAIYIALGISSVHAQYRYVTGDPIAVQEKLVSDLQAGRLDRTNLDQSVNQAIQQQAPFSPNGPQLNQLGGMSKVCLLFGVKSTNARNLAIRTVHQRGCGDWLIASSEVPEVVRSIAFRAIMGDPNNCGAPTFLPPPPAPSSSASFYIPPQLTCTNVRSLQ